MNRPDFLCIGAQKAGTSWLHNMLQQHPDTFFGPFKEYQYFNSVFVHRHRAWTEWHITNSVKNAMLRHLNSSSFDPYYLSRLGKIADPSFMFTQAWYEYIFSADNARRKLKGDITPEYSTIPYEGVKYIKDYLISAKIIYIIRNPVSRAISQINMNIERGHEFETDEEKVNWDVINRGNYMSYIPTWDEVFGNDILYIPYRDIADDPSGVLRRVECHLGLRPYNYHEAQKKVHVTKRSKISTDLKRILERELAPQKQFLEKRFDACFMSRI